MQFSGNTYKAHPDFCGLYSLIEGKTMIDRKKLQVMYEVAIMSHNLTSEGHVAECGVWHGGALYMLARIFKDRKVFGLDSWKGLPDTNEKDLVDGKDVMPKGWGGCKPPEWITEQNVILKPGWFSDTLKELPDEQYAFVHIDADRYSSIKECLEFFYPRMVKYGVIVLDDYGFHLTPGAEKAVDEFFGQLSSDWIYYKWANLILIKVQ